jgi:hypothetical protein
VKPGFGFQMSDSDFEIRIADLDADLTSRKGAKIAKGWKNKMSDLIHSKRVCLGECPVQKAAA